jgi:small-conductance mechanosensitive channel
MRAFMSKHRSLGGLVILALFLIIAIFVATLAKRFLLAIVRRTKTQLDDAIFERVFWPIGLSILLIGAILAQKWVFVQETYDYVLGGILETALVLTWSLTLNRLFKRISLDWTRRWRQTDRQGIEMIRLGENITRLLVMAGAVFFLLSIWEINLTPFLASAGIAGIAIALAAKETLSNFFGGMSILLDKPFKAGDYIILDTGERGEVVEVGMRSTRIMTRDDVQISIPNSVITNTKVVNESAPVPNFRVRIKVGVAYGTDVDKVEEILLDVAGNNHLVVSKPEPRVRFRTFGDSSLDFELLCWAHRPHDKGRLIHELNRAIYKAFNAAGIVIPFPQRDVHMHSVPISETK